MCRVGARGGGARGAAGALPRALCGEAAWMREGECAEVARESVRARCGESGAERGRRAAERRAGFVRGAGRRGEAQGSGGEGCAGQLTRGEGGSGTCGGAGACVRGRHTGDPAAVAGPRRRCGGCGGGQGRGRGPRAGGGGSLCSAGPRRRWNKGAAALLPALSLVLAEAPRSHRGPPDRSSPLGQTRPGGTGWPSRWDRPRMKKTQHPDGIERRARQGCGDRRRAARPEPRPVRSAQPGAVPERVPPAHPSPRVPPTPLGNSRVGSKSCGGSVPLLSRLRPQPSAAA